MFSLIAAMGSSLSSSDASASTASGSGVSSIIMIVIMLAIFYFLLIRPQQKRDKEAKQMMASLKKGDKIVTIGGIHGTVSAVTESSVFVKVDDNTKIEFSKSAISSVLNKSAETVTKKDVKKTEPAKAEEVVEAPKKAKKTSKKAEAPAAEPVAEPAAEEAKPEEKN